MRRGITLLVLVFAILVGMQNNLNFVQSHDNFIPEEAIRLRIVANSDSDSDQELKLMVRDEVLRIINGLVKDINDRDEARRIIYDNIEQIEGAVVRILEENNVPVKYSVEYGKGYFPDKTYGSKLYPEGMYESVYIVLGDGEGENWWCVLFPPLCLSDITSDGGINNDEDTEIQYSFLIVETLKELFGYNK